MYFLKRINKFASYIYLIFILTLIASFFIDSIHNIQTLKYDWDLDNNMYFGRRLWEGELLWTKEFHDKLPFIQTKEKTRVAKHCQNNAEIRTHSIICTRFIHQYDAPLKSKRTRCTAENT